MLYNMGNHCMNIACCTISPIIWSEKRKHIASLKYEEKQTGTEENRSHNIMLTTAGKFVCALWVHKLP